MSYRIGFFLQWVDHITCVNIVVSLRCLRSELWRMLTAALHALKGSANWWAVDSNGTNRNVGYFLFFIMSNVTVFSVDYKTHSTNLVRWGMETTGRLRWENASLQSPSFRSQRHPRHMRMSCNSWHKWKWICYFNNKSSKWKRNSASKDNCFNNQQSQLSVL